MRCLIRFRCAGFGFCVWIGRLRRCFDHNVCVGAAHSERANAGNSPIGIGPVGRLRQNVDRNFVPGNVWVGRFEIQLPWNLVFLDRQQDFDQARHAGGGFEMADVRFDRADEQRIFLCSVFSQRGSGSLHLDWIAQLGPGAVGFEVANISRCNSGSRNGLPNDFFLRLRIGRGQAAAETVVPDCRAANDSNDGIAVCLGVGQTAKRDDSTTFATQVTVGRRVERS